MDKEAETPTRNVCIATTPRLASTVSVHNCDLL